MVVIFIDYGKCKSSSWVEGYLCLVINKSLLCPPSGSCCLFFDHSVATLSFVKQTKGYVKCFLPNCLRLVLYVLKLKVLKLGKLRNREVFSDTVLVWNKY